MKTKIKPRHIYDRVHAYNLGRAAELAEFKFAKMRGDVFRFFRGTCHLMAEDWSLETTENVPLTWVCGDLHTENFGSYKGENRLVYFDINDFDESLLAPATFDITRLTTSIFVAADAYQFSTSEAYSLAQIYLDSYAATLQYGKAGAIERVSSRGIVSDLLHSVQDRTRKVFLDERTVLKKYTRRIIADAKRYSEVNEEIFTSVQNCIETFGEKVGKPDFFRVLDVKRRIAGTGSLGIRRYAILVEGNGAEPKNPHKNYILDLKEAFPSSLESFVRQHTSAIQPVWANDAVRVVEIQHRMQFSTPAMLSTIELLGKHFILRELQPTQDKLDLASIGGKYKRFGTALATMGELTAYAQLRSSGRQGSATADALIEFAFQAAWKLEVLKYAEQYAKQVHLDFVEFVNAKV
jgi:uncharacterized protein (DUF2252 family)